MMRTILSARTVFDGWSCFHDHEVVLDGDRIVTLRPATRPPLPGILAPGLIDLQVNGGGGWMVGGDATPERLAALCDTHAGLGATGILPTLITDTPAATAAVIAAGAQTRAPGFLGLHLEGPHLDPRRHGAHDPALIRPMAPPDLAALAAAARALPALVVTLAPTAVTPDQIAQLTAAGVRVSLGHAECSFDQAMAARAAGARMVTHLFNAMSPLAHRAPGLAGAALAGDFAAGIIADGVHVHPAALAIALRAKAESDLYLVTDAMAPAGTDAPRFTLGGREILRQGGSLRLADGTLAGADLTLPRAIAQIVAAGAPLERALAMATRIPADLVGAADRGRLRPGARADLVLLDGAGGLARVWRGGEEVPSPAPN
ncbi:N-acetylglucosamine 6-phosphate deacetylase [Phaeovulum vinaykumarii]|uniref:N-acetylglucosamine 6-phosphate deacetylase n=2 Tax=Phaeovulum vinaykumarii TaxID=407234 RepID=A0A1N7KRC2_9RHOB|nr:N-acetylglucosamine 6-phosphate deacetylase [Phaeovulum vinaykumarii]SOC01659.1 N-acetylglucosamine 6-phosphate deacetylase [Phaeovulum vinaykumarii]